MMVMRIKTVVSRVVAWLHHHLLTTFPQALVLLALSLFARCREDVAAPVRPGERSTRDWDKAAQKQEEDEAERAKIREMGGKDTALVNVLEGSVEDGKIHSVGDRTKGIAMTNFAEVPFD